MVPSRKLAAIVLPNDSILVSLPSHNYGPIPQKSSQLAAMRNPSCPWSANTIIILSRLKVCTLSKKYCTGSSSIVLLCGESISLELIHPYSSNVHPAHSRSKDLHE
ncbi:hypothetical protein EYC80_006036 [Monilinia laxa]|uniref:Uncharacterized protein n=1 Tax=Monilinia laxa TaxID=61186 RepID=A0A5N6KG52_MONLA|nr:hypothetical protein EYC80_006036 [Monilinia laxa]